MAAYPLFPRGSWPLWNPKISLDGSFMQCWMDREHAMESMSPLASEEVLSNLWEEFTHVASLFFPYELIQKDT
jgi:hypothetical protein